MSHHDFNSKLEYSLPIFMAHQINEAVTQTVPSIRSEVLDQVAQNFTASLKPEAVKSFNGRLERGLVLAKNGAVIACPEPEHPRCFRVRSSDGTQFYKVDLDARTCECPDFRNGHCCKHRIAAYFIEQAWKVEQCSTMRTLPHNPQPRPTCSIAPSQEGKVKPTCTISPTRTEFERAEKSAAVVVPPNENPAVPIVHRTEKEILADMGFDTDASNVKEDGLKLGSLYKRYLHGSDLNQQVYPVTVRDVTMEKVCPHPSLPVEEKACLWVDGLPEGFATGILFGARGEDDLIAIFGKVNLKELKGKSLLIYSKPITVGGQTKLSIRFRRAV